MGVDQERSECALGTPRRMDDIREAVRFSILAEGAEDYLSFHDFLWEVHETLGVWDSGALFNGVISMSQT